MRDKHSGVRHVCELCGATYNWKISLARHRKTCPALRAARQNLGLSDLPANVVTSRYSVTTGGMAQLAGLAGSEGLMSVLKDEFSIQTSDEIGDTGGTLRMPILPRMEQLTPAVVPQLLPTTGDYGNLSFHSQEDVQHTLARNLQEEKYEHEKNSKDS